VRKKKQSLKNPSIRPLQFHLYSLLDKPKWFCFSKEGGLIKKLLKKFTPEEILYTFKYSKEILCITPKSYSWLVNQEFKLVNEALRHKVLQEEIAKQHSNRFVKEKIDESIEDARTQQVKEKTALKENIFKKIFGV
jgi:hypothetical protein